MSTFIGYYRATESFVAENLERARREGPGADEKFTRMVVELPGKLPNGLSIIGSYSPMASGPVVGSQLPSIMIVDAETPGDLSFITNYYAGYLYFQWQPATVVGASRAQREAWQAQAAQPARAR